MNRDPVASTNIVSLGYDDPSETLEVEFSSGSVYQYYNVPPSIWTELFAAPSKGQFLNAYIKNAYPFSRVG
ncbi:KTSC domain-containing protein [Sphingomonas faeni]|uniref:KTSC domain-containing protein n=1 Tax=Sphingomonas faeni TaxID=185950 RepID=UPI003353BE30